MKSPWVSDWVIWVAMERRRHNLSVFLRMFGSGTAVKQGTGWYLSHGSVEGATYETVFPAIQISAAEGVKPNDRPHRRNVCTDMLNCLKEYNFFLDKTILSDEATCHLLGKVNRHNLSIWGSQNPLQVVEVQRKMDRSWRLHSMATQIAQSDTHGLFISGIRER
jgi:hypothetical protein